MELSLRLLKKLKIPAKIILNRADIGDKNLIAEISKKYKIKTIAEIPYSKKILEAYSKGESIKDKNIKKIAEFLGGLR